ncbi:MAG: hypothetical protein RLZZ165_1364, partial [Bacteroidota bacterium]
MRKTPSRVVLFWFRRDLRLADNHGLFQALQTGFPVVPMFIFDRDILDLLLDAADPRVTFIHDTLSALNQQLLDMGSSLLVRHGKPAEVWHELIDEFEIEAVFANRDYEPAAVRRDEAVKQILGNRGIAFHTYKDHVVFAGSEVVKDDGKPYTVFTPYSRKWLARLGAGNPLAAFPSESLLDQLHRGIPFGLPSLEDLGFTRSSIALPSRDVDSELIQHYDQTRDFPGIRGTSRLGIHLRFGTVSIRETARRASALNATFLNELIWRDF